MHRSSRKPVWHLWFPNLFEFKGGIQVYLQDLLQALESELLEGHLVVFDKLDQAKPAERFNSNQVSFVFSGHLSGILQTLHFATNLIISALIDRPTLILCGHLNFAPIALLIHRLTGIPYWILVYGVDAWQVENPWKKQALQQAEKIVSISRYTRDRLIQEQNLVKSKFSLLPVTFAVDQFHITPKPDYLLQRYNLTVDQPIIFTVTRLATADRYKGYDQIISSLTKIRQQIPNIHYLLGGKGDDRPRIEGLITELNMQDCVTLTGFIPDHELGDYYNLCDVFAMPSKGEGFGIVYLEALACGKPTVGGNQDGAIDALCDGELGVLVDPDNIEMMAHVLTQILQRTYVHPLLYHPEQLRQRVIDIFGFKQFQTTLAILIQQTLETGGKQ